MVMVLRKVITGCTRDCPGGCSLIAESENQEITRLTGNPDHEITRGFLCTNTSNYINNVFYNKNRILHPLIKKDGEWNRIGWDKALNIVSEKIKELQGSRTSSILYYQGFGSRTALKLLNNRFFNLLGGVTLISGTICGGIGQAGQEMDLGTRFSHDPIDHLNSKLTVIWGRNPVTTDVHLWRILKRSQRNGTILVVIDPVKTKTAKKSDLHLQPKAGSDVYLAMALSKVLLSSYKVDWDFIEKRTNNFKNYKNVIQGYSLKELSNKCQIKTEKIVELAHLYHENSPASIITGWGLHRYINGHLTFRFIDALAAISGNIGISGGGVSQGFEEFGFFNKQIQLNEMGINQRTFSMPKIGEDILKSEPKIKLGIISSGNPVNLNPNSGKVKKAFESVDFVVMIDHFLNDTSEVADLFLPATTFLEEEDLVGSYGHNWISPVNKVVNPVGECKSELEIFQILAKKLGFGKEMEGTPNYWLKKIASPLIENGVGLDELSFGPVKMITEIPYKNGKFSTESGLFEFVGEFTESHSISDDFPIRLISTMPENWIGSVIPESEKKRGLIKVNLNPKTIQKYGLDVGNTVTIESEVGKIDVITVENCDVPEDIIHTFRGGWSMYGKNINVLTKDITSTAGNGAPYHETCVRIEEHK